MMSGGRISEDRMPRSIASANSNPSANEPDTLMTIVPSGNAVPNRSPTQMSSAYRASAPNAPPTAMRIHVMSRECTVRA